VHFIRQILLYSPNVPYRYRGIIQTVDLIFRAHPATCAAGPGYPLQFLDPSHTCMPGLGKIPGGRIPKMLVESASAISDTSYLRYVVSTIRYGREFQIFSRSLPQPRYTPIGGSLQRRRYRAANGWGVCGISASIPCAGQNRFAVLVRPNGEAIWPFAVR
jgi:hypothetical protein